MSANMFSVSRAALMFVLRPGHVNWTEFVKFIGDWLAQVEGAAPIIAAAPMSPKAKRKATDDEVEVL